MAVPTEALPTITVNDSQEFGSQDGQGQPLPSPFRETQRQETLEQVATEAAAKDPAETPKNDVEKPQDKQSESGEKDPTEPAGQKPEAQKPEEQQQQTEEKKPEDQKPEASADLSGLSRGLAFTEEELQELEDLNFTGCKKCGQTVELAECVVRGPQEMWCKACNALYVMLKRNMCWPPKEFESMDEVSQQQFFVRCQKEKEAAKKSQFCYTRVRETLNRVLVEEQVRLKRVAVGGTYLPLSVYRQRGYTIDEEFELRNPKQWSHGLNEWTFMLVETSIHEEDIKSSIEKSIVSCEKNIKKRKQETLEENGKNQEDLENKSARTDATMVMDLVTESEDEGGCGN